MSVTWLQMTLSLPMATMELEYHRSSKSSVWPTFVWCGRNFIILHFPMDTERPIDLYIFIYLHIYVLSKSRDFCLMWKKQLSLVSNKCRKANWSYANIVICFLNPGRPNDERSGPALSPSTNEVYLHYIKVIIKVLYGNQGLKKAVRVITAIKKLNLSQRGKGRES